mmetsp:Transcript_24077/g.71596  ORF Transcript_24077/g.71596 Transcript_24077/m.71596 type:complete len:428 (+) Transcript_24077:1204-2487(+)
MTCRMVRTSRPRAATSVATSTCARPLLTLSRTRSRRPCSKSPCSDSARTPSTLRSMYSATISASRFRLTKTMVWQAREERALPWPSSFIAASIFSIRSEESISLAPRASQSRTCCTIDLAATSSSSPPTLIRTGSSRKSIASLRTSEGHVAENMKVCRPPSAGKWSTISRSCGSKPMSSMRSASSRTRCRTFFVRIVWSRSMSFSRPGVPTTKSSFPPSISTSRSCRYFRMPPKTQVVRQPKAAARGLASSWICCASSRVGASTNARGPRVDRSALRAAAASQRRGSRKPSVFPDPVCAIATTSRPASVSGSDCAWIGLGASNPRLCKKWATAVGSGWSTPPTVRRSAANDVAGVASTSPRSPVSVMPCCSAKLPALAAAAAAAAERRRRRSSWLSSRRGWTRGWRPSGQRILPPPTRSGTSSRRRA